jgi:glycine/D-amino acid oxidase-like deaminating enzyme
MKFRYDIMPASSMARVLDAAIIGLGAMGSGAASSLSHHTPSVIGFDRFRPPHSFGSHRSDTRVFRAAYPESPDYVPPAQLAGELWERLELETSTRLLTRCGLLTIGPEYSDPIRGINNSTGCCALPVARLASAEIRRRHSAFQPPDDSVGRLETTAGWLNVDGALAGKTPHPVDFLRLQG